MVDSAGSKIERLPHSGEPGYPKIYQANAILTVRYRTKGYAEIGKVLRLNLTCAALCAALKGSLTSRENRLPLVGEIIEQSVPARQDQAPQIEFCDRVGAGRSAQTAR